MKKGFYETYYPSIFFAGLLADELIDGLKHGVEYAPFLAKPSKERTEEKLAELSKHYHLAVAVNFLRGEEYCESCEMAKAGWKLVLPRGALCWRRHLPYNFSLYGFPKKSGEVAPALPETVRKATPSQYRRLMKNIIKRIEFRRDEQ